MVEKARIETLYQTRTRRLHCSMKSANNHVRRNLPQPIIDFMQEKGVTIQKKIQITWIVCYLSKNFPDQTKEKWENYDCSHLCISWGIPEGSECISPDCLHWESKSVNQSRGSTVKMCTKKCTHCDRILCLCQNLHSPCCL
jgi:hypothetical protein